METERTMSELEELIETDPLRVVVVGGGVAGLLVARELARPGFEVTLLEASGRLGGSVARLDIAGVTTDAGAESFATRGGHVAELLHDLHLDSDVVEPNPAGAWLQLPDRAVPTPKAGLLGIPSSPLASDVVAAIGWRGALRAYLDRLMPVMTIGEEHNLGRLVRRRMGRAVLESLVAPVTTGVYSADPDRIDVAIAAPGLNAALTRSGSLSGAVAELRGGQAAKAGSAVGGVRGGIFRIAEALSADAVYRGATLRTEARVTSLERSGDSFLVGVEGDETPLEVDALVIATPSASAVPLLASAGTALAEAAAQDWPDATSVELVTLAVDAPSLDTAPRGTGLLVSDRVDPRRILAKALTHVTAKWSWVAEQLPPGRHLVRLSYGRAGGPATSFAMSDSELRATAVRDASALLGVALADADVVDFARVRWTNAQPLAGDGQSARLDRLKAAIEATEHVEATGSWVAGTGLASVIPHARDAAARIRAIRWRQLSENRSA